jgi:hypothetical protein
MAVDLLDYANFAIHVYGQNSSGGNREGQGDSAFPAACVRELDLLEDSLTFAGQHPERLCICCRTLPAGEFGSGAPGA